MPSRYGKQDIKLVTKMKKHVKKNLIEHMQMIVIHHNKTILKRFFIKH